MRFFTALAGLFMMIGGAQASSELPLPRFVSLNASPVNLRTGPGVRYPVEWVYMKQDLPVSIIEEFENWRKIRDCDGVEGWVHQHMLSGRRTVRLTKDTLLLRAPTKDSLPIAKVEAGVVGRLMLCPANLDLCKVELQRYQGWVEKRLLYGIKHKEVYTP